MEITDKELEIISLYYKLKAGYKVAYELKIPTEYVYTVIQKHNLPNKHEMYRRELNDDVIQLYNIYMVIVKKYQEF